MWVECPSGLNVYSFASNFFPTQMFFQALSFSVKLGVWSSYSKIRLFFQTRTLRVVQRWLSGNKEQQLLSGRDVRAACRDRQRIRLWGEEITEPKGGWGQGGWDKVRFLKAGSLSNTPKGEVMTSRMFNLWLNTVKGALCWRTKIPFSLNVECKWNCVGAQCFPKCECFNV